MGNRRLLNVAASGGGTQTIKLYPSAYAAGSNFTASNTSNPVGKSYTNTTYATLNSSTTKNVTCYAYYKFDTSAIPTGATIVSVECTAKGYVNTTTTTRVKTPTLQMCNGTTAKGSAAVVTTTATESTIACGTWTRTELNDTRIRIQGVRGSGTTGFAMRFYGAELTITYKIQ